MFKNILAVTQNSTLNGMNGMSMSSETGSFVSEFVHHCFNRVQWILKPDNKLFNITVNPGLRVNVGDSQVAFK